MNSVIELIKNIKPGVEFEIKLGKYINNKFIVGVTKEQFDTLFTQSDLYFNDDVVDESKTIVCISNSAGNGAGSTGSANSNSGVGATHSNIRRITYFDNKYKIIKTEYQKKENIKNGKLEMISNGMRLSLSNETDIVNIKNMENNKSLNFDNNCYRYKERVSKLSNDKLWRFDFTLVVDMMSKNATSFEKMSGVMERTKVRPLRREVEIEYIGKINGNNKNGIDKIKQSFDDIVKQIGKYYNPISGNNRKHGRHGKYHKQRNAGDNVVFKPLFMNDIGNNIRKIKLNKSASLKKEHIPIIVENGKYSVTDKADGERYLLRISSIGRIYYVTNIGKIIKTGISIGVDNKSYFDTLIDGEYVDGKYYAFDIMMAGNIDVRQKQLMERYKLLQSIVSNIGNDNILIKKFYFDNVSENSRKIWNDKKEYPYELDGLIFTPIEEGYYGQVYKWKPANMLTFDFLIRFNKDTDLYDNFAKVRLYSAIAKRQLGNKKPDMEEFKHLGNIHKIDYYPILFKPNSVACIEIEEKNGRLYHADIEIKDEQIIEFSYHIDVPEIYQRWKPYRLREDKTKVYQIAKKQGKYDGPNNWASVMGNWDIVNDPVDIEDIV